MIGIREGILSQMLELASVIEELHDAYLSSYINLYIRNPSANRASLLGETSCQRQMSS
jgi:hypothetical protein